jgi:hypothetical protein
MNLSTDAYLGNHCFFSDPVAIYPRLCSIGIQSCRGMLCIMCGVDVCFFGLCTQSPFMNLFGFVVVTCSTPVRCTPYKNRVLSSAHACMMCMYALSTVKSERVDLRCCECTGQLYTILRVFVPYNCTRSPIEVPLWDRPICIDLYGS